MNGSAIACTSACVGGFDTVKITSIYPIASSNTVALAWSTDVGRVSRVQSEKQSDRQQLAIRHWRTHRHQNKHGGRPLRWRLNQPVLPHCPGSMSTRWTFVAYWCWLLPALAVLLASAICLVAGLDKITTWLLKRGAGRGRFGGFPVRGTQRQANLSAAK